MNKLFEIFGSIARLGINEVYKRIGEYPVREKEIDQFKVDIYNMVQRTATEEGQAAILKYDTEHKLGQALWHGDATTKPEFTGILNRLETL